MNDGHFIANNPGFFSLFNDVVVQPFDKRRWPVIFQAKLAVLQLPPIGMGAASICELRVKERLIVLYIVCNIIWNCGDVKAILPRIYDDIVHNDTLYGMLTPVAPSTLMNSSKIKQVMVYAVTVRIKARR